MCCRAGGGETSFLLNGYHAIRYLPGLPGPGPGHFFLGEKVTKTPPGTPRSPYFCLINLYLWGNSSATEFRSFSNLQLVVNETSPAGLLKGDMFLGVHVEKFFL